VITHGVTVAFCHPVCAAALAAWDRHILTNRHSLLEVEAELKKVGAGQDALERKLYMLETHQKVGPRVDSMGQWAGNANLLSTPVAEPDVHAGDSPQGSLHRGGRAVVGRAW
jgi:hypothetical protein